MLTLGRIPTARLKCPRHPRYLYTDESSLPASCDCCRAIYRVLIAHVERDRLQRMAEGMLERASLGRRAARTT